MGINPHEFIEANRDNLTALQQQDATDPAQEARLDRATITQEIRTLPQTTNAYALNRQSLKPGQGIACL